MISLTTYTTSTLNVYQQEIAQLNNGSYKQWTMFSLDSYIKTVTSPVCKSLCSYYLLTLILEFQCHNNMNFISCSCYTPVRGRGGGHRDVFFAVFQTSGWYRLCHLSHLASIATLAINIQLAGRKWEGYHVWIFLWSDMEVKHITCTPSTGHT